MLIVAISHEAFAYVAEFSEAHERWEIDEIFTTLIIMPVALVIYAVRRLRETHRELARRRAAGYSLRADHSAGKGLMLGVEAGGGLSGEGGDAHWIGPVLSLWPNDADIFPAWELTFFLALTSKKLDLRLRLELERAF